MELSILKLASPRRRSLHLGFHGSRFTFDHELANGTSNPASPHASSPSSQRWCSSTRIVTEDDDIYTTFEQNRVAVPFKWEESPGTRRVVETVKPFKSEDIAGILGAMGTVKEEDLSDQENFSGPLSRSSSSSSGNSLTSDKVDSSSQMDSFTTAVCGGTSDSDYEFLCSPARVLSNNSSELNSTNACKGQILRLRPPPCMQSIKQLLTLETDDRCLSFTSLTFQSLISNTSPKKPRRSFRKDGLKALPFLTSPRKEHHDEHVNTMLGFEEWPKGPHENGAGHKANVSYSFRTKCKGIDDDLDSIFNEDFGKKGGLRERRPLSSVSSRTLADGYNFSRPLLSVSSRGLADGYNFRNKFCAPDDSDCEYSDAECNPKNDYSNTYSHTIVEEEKEQHPEPQKKSSSTLVDNNLEIVKWKRKRHALRRLSRFFKDSLSKPSRTSAVWPAPPINRKTSVSPTPLSPPKSSVAPVSLAPPKSSVSPASVRGKSSSISPAAAPQRKSLVSPALVPPRKSSGLPAPSKSSLSSSPAPLVARSKGELKLKHIHHSKNPLLQMCLSNSLGQALLKNVKQIRSFEFQTPRAVTAK